MDDKTGIRVGLGRVAGGEAKPVLYRKLPWGSELYREKPQPQKGGKEPGARPTAGTHNGSRAMLVWDGVGTWPLAVGGIFNKQCSKPASPGTFTQSRLLWEQGSCFSCVGNSASPVSREPPPFEHPRNKQERLRAGNIFLSLQNNSSPAGNTLHVSGCR